MKQPLKRPRSLYSPDSIWQAYEAARSGCNDKQIAASIGISYPMLKQHCIKHPALQNAINRGRQIAANQTPTFYRYAWEHLTEKSKRIWRRLQRYRLEPNGIRRIEFLLEDYGSSVRKDLFLYALTCANFIPQDAMKKIGITRQTFDRWVEEDFEFAELVAEIERMKGDLFESKYIEKVIEGDSGVILHANKTYNRRRGYGDTVDLRMNGKVEHAHTHEVRFDLSELNVPIEVKRTVLEALRKKRLQEEPIEAKLLEGPVAKEN